jgi:D-aspartate ligase
MKLLWSFARETMPTSDYTPKDVSTPAVVLGCFRQGGIGIVRSLGRIGVPVYAIDADRFAAAFFSKYCRESFLWDIHRAPYRESLRFLIELGNKLGRRSVLIPTSDTGAMFVAEQAEHLAERFIFPNQSKALVRSLCSKKEMHQIAKRSDIPTPETSFPTTRDEVLDYLSVARFPILVKPIYNNMHLGRVRPWRIFLVHNARELLDCYELIEDPVNPNVMLQEYIPGPDSATWTFNGYFDRDSRCLMGLTGRKLRNYPPYFGQASLGICQRNDEVEKNAVIFMERIGYSGPLDIGFRYDCRDGQYKVNDVNPRIGAMFRVFVGNNGMDVARALYQDLTNQPISCTLPQEGRKWIVEDVDWLSAIRYWRDGNLTVKEWIGSLSGIKELTFLARDDLLPFIGVCMQNAIHAFSACLSAFKSKLRKVDDLAPACVATHSREPGEQ